MVKRRKSKINDVIDDESKDSDIDSSFQDVENKVDKLPSVIDDEKKPIVDDKKKPDFSFENEAEKAVEEIQKADYSDEKKPDMHHITEKASLGMEIKHNLPDKDFLKVKAEKGTVKFIDKYGEEREEKKVIITSKDVEGVDHVEITDGLFAMDFRNDCNFWFNRSPNVVPAMIKQAVHTHVDIKKCYEMEKRKLELPLLLILALIGGAAIILVMLISLMS